MQTKDSETSFNINKLNKTEADELGRQIGDQVRQICDDACEKANRILNKYGMKAQMQIAINGINEELSKTQDKPKRKRAAKKGDNL